MHVAESELHTQRVQAQAHEINVVSYSLDFSSRFRSAAHLADDHVLQMVGRLVVLEFDVEAVFDAHFHLEGVQCIRFLGSSRPSIARSNNLHKMRTAASPIQKDCYPSQKELEMRKRERSK